MIKIYDENPYYNYKKLKEILSNFNLINCVLYSNICCFYSEKKISTKLKKYFKNFSVTKGIYYMYIVKFMNDDTHEKYKIFAKKEKIKEIQQLENIIIDNTIVYKDNNYIHIIINDKIYSYNISSSKFDAIKVAIKMAQWDIESVNFCDSYCWIFPERNITELLKKYYTKINDIGNNQYSISFKNNEGFLQ